MDMLNNQRVYILYIYIWLVVNLPLWKIVNGKNDIPYIMKKQMFQTTNQISNPYENGLMTDFLPRFFGFS